jgi:glucosamine--fructose-6-phosphate aminotransferase (isomerizing)
VNAPGSDLERAAEYLVPLRAGDERAVAATKSFLASLAALLPLLADLSGDTALHRATAGLPDQLDRTLQLEPAAQALADQLAAPTRLVVLARGLHFGAAQETALKLKETSGVHAEAYSAAEFSHGPQRLLAEGLPLLGFAPVDAAASATAHAYADLRAAGATLHTVGPARDSTLLTPATGHAVTDVLPSVLAAYLLAGHVALARGLDPDHPPLLSKVTRTR